MAKRKPKPEAEPRDEFEATLVALLRDLDDIGVQMVEANWRALKDDEQRTVAKWASTRKAGTKSPLPLCLIPWASTELKNEYAPYAEEQEAARQVLLPLDFLKPAISKKDEDGNRRIKLSGNIPFTAIRGGECDRLFRFKHCKVEFSARSVDQWDVLPGTEDSLPQIITVAADFSGYTATRHATKISWLVDESDGFSKDDAFDLEDCKGSIRIEVMGEASEKKSEEEHATEKPHKPDPKQKTLPETQFAQSVEFEVAISGDSCCRVTLNQDADGWYTEVDQECPAAREPLPTYGIPHRQADREAMAARVGQLVDQWSAIEGEEPKKIVGLLKQWVRAIAAGTPLGEIVAVPF